MKYYLAIDVGASSGRHIVGWKENNEIQTKEIYRFETGFKQMDDKLICDVEKLYSNVLSGLKLAFGQYPEIESLAIDTWGVDYVLMNGDEEILPCMSYRDSRTSKAVEQVHKLVPFEQLYSKTGIQFQPFNTIYQLYADKLTGKLDKATDCLMLPEYLNYKLTGNKVKEYTNATTTGLVNAHTKQFDEEIITKLSLPKLLFKELHEAGMTVGKLTFEVQQYVGGNCKVKLCLSHDTASAVYAIPLDDDSLYISSGTWSLLGVTTNEPVTDVSSMQSNYSNEGGIHQTVRYQKNIPGMWLVNRLRDELCPNVTFSEIVEQARNSTFGEAVDVNDEIFLSPKSMKQAFDDNLVNTPSTVWDYFRSAYVSLAIGYKKAIDELKANTHKTYTKLYVVGGGAKNTFLNELTAKATKLQVIPLPIEATAIGNLKIQMEN